MRGERFALSRTHFLLGTHAHHPRIPTSPGSPSFGKRAQTTWTNHLGAHRLPYSQSTPSIRPIERVPSHFFINVSGSPIRLTALSDQKPNQPFLGLGGLAPGAARSRLHRHCLQGRREVPGTLNSDARGIPDTCLWAFRELTYPVSALFLLELEYLAFSGQ